MCTPAQQQSTLIEQVKYVTSKFPFAAERVSPIAGSVRCFKVDARNMDGKKTKLFLKSFEQPPDEQIELEMEALTNGFPLIPEFYRSHDNSSIVADSGKFWTCQPFIASDMNYDWMEFSCGTQHCFAAGQVLAELHSAGRRALKSGYIGAPRSLAVKLQTFPVKFEETRRKFLTVANSCKTNQTMLPATKILSQLPFDKITSRVEQICRKVTEFESAAAAHQTINHGDYHPGNLLFAANKVSAVVDWEYARVASPLYDLSYALFAFCMVLPEPGKASGELFNAGNTERLLEGYGAASSAVKNVQHLKVYSDLICLLNLKWVCDELCLLQSAYVGHPKFEALVTALALCCQM